MFLPFFSLLTGSTLLSQVNSLSVSHRGVPRFIRSTQTFMSSSAETDSWTTLQSLASGTKVGAALDAEREARNKGIGAPFVQNNLRLFGSNARPKLTLYRDHAGRFMCCTYSVFI